MLSYYQPQFFSQFLNMVMLAMTDNLKLRVNLQLHVEGNSWRGPIWAICWFPSGNKSLNYVTEYPIGDVFSKK